MQVHYDGEPQKLVSMVESIVDAVEVPVTAKMRLGTGQGPNNAVNICQSLERVGAQRLCIHGRTLRQRYSGVADWKTIETAVQSVDVPVVANGDITDADSARRCLEITNASGLMIGRAAIGRPDIFAQIKVGLGWMDEYDLPWVKRHRDEWEELSETSKAFASVDGVGIDTLPFVERPQDLQNKRCSVMQSLFPRVYLEQNRFEH